ncbi:MAG: biopolymer transporter ExbD, partial [Gammaproteobacteria bacterium]|nr:biopolymer transporter ExbD [Gammaproteobacteria bacterium]
MRLRARPVEEPELNIINFVDVMLMLLVFFMMTTHFIQNTSL